MMKKYGAGGMGGRMGGIAILRIAYSNQKTYKNGFSSKNRKSYFSLLKYSISHKFKILNFTKGGEGVENKLKKLKIIN